MQTKLFNLRFPYSMGFLFLLMLVLPWYCTEESFIPSIPKEPYPPEYCAFFDTGEVDSIGLDYDGDGITNNWDYCPNNVYEWLDSDRDTIGNNSDTDMDGDGVVNDLDDDMDGDGYTNTEENDSGSDPMDPASIPDHPFYTYDQGIFNTTPGWYKGDFHNHTTHSDGSGSVDESLANAEKFNFDFHIITDHNNVYHLFDEDWESETMPLISGYEWTQGGHANFFGVKHVHLPDNDDDYDQVKESWTRAKLQGGLLSINHYNFPPWKEWWDQILPARPDIIAMLDAMEIWNGSWSYSGILNPGSIDRWMELLNEGYKIAAIGGSDSHDFGMFPICFPSTFVYAEQLSSLSILAGVMKGRTYVSNAYPYYVGTDVNSDAPMLEFVADAVGGNRYEAMIGDTIPLGNNRFKVTIDKVYGRIEIIKNGTVLHTFTDFQKGKSSTNKFTDEATTASWYIVRMYEDTNGHLLLISSPIYAE